MRGEWTKHLFTETLSRPLEFSDGREEISNLPTAPLRNPSNSELIEANSAPAFGQAMTDGCLLLVCGALCLTMEGEQLPRIYMGALENQVSCYIQA